MTTEGKGEEQRKKQVPHPSALRAYGLRMTMKATAKVTAEATATARQRQGQGRES
jgi:hypothetical protein